MMNMEEWGAQGTGPLERIRGAIFGIAMIRRERLFFIFMIFLIWMKGMDCFNFWDCSKVHGNTSVGGEQEGKDVCKIECFFYYIMFFF